MAAIRLGPFRGTVPRVDPRHIQPDQAQVAVNTNLLSNALRARFSDVLNWTPTKAGALSSIYRFAADATTKYWFHWTVTEAPNGVSVIRGPIADNITERTYIFGAGIPKVTDNSIAVQGGNLYPMATYDLGLPVAVNAELVATAVANTDDSLNESTSYVMTYVSGWGEEGPPSLPSNIIKLDTGVFNQPKYTAKAYVKGNRVEPTVANGFVYEVTVAGTSGAEPTWPTVAGQTVVSGGVTFVAVSKSISLTLPTIPNTGVYNITLKRIYRAATGAYGTSYQFLAEVPAAQATYSDSTPTESLGETIPSENWDMPPAGLRGVVAMPNGVMVGYTGNDLCFSEPFQGHAWPISYRQSTDYPIMGVGVYGNSVVVTTTNKPYMVTGSHPSSMTMTKVDIAQSCVSPLGVVDVGRGIAYPSPDGMVLAGPGFSLQTASLMTRKEWQALNPSTIHGYFYDGMYIGFYDATTIGGVKGGFILDTENPQNGITWLDTHYTTGFVDTVNNTLFLIDVNGGIMEWNAGVTPLTYQWKSKVFKTPKPVSFACARVFASAYPVTFKVYADGSLKHTQTVANSDMFRLPSGFMSDEWELELSGTNDITSVEMASSVEELKALP